MTKEAPTPTGVDALAHWDTIGVPSYVYFIQAGDDGPVKIGLSEKPLYRMYNLQGANAHKLHLRHVIPGDIIAERQLHRRFFDARMQGEWFGNGYQTAILLFGHALSDICLQVHKETGFAPETMYCLRPCTRHEMLEVRDAYSLKMRGAIDHTEWERRHFALDGRVVA